MPNTPRDIFERLVAKAYCLGYLIAGSHARKVQQALAAGTEIPEKCLPGRVIMSLSDEERKALAGLTSEMTQDRQDKDW